MSAANQSQSNQEQEKKFVTADRAKFMVVMLCDELRLQQMPIDKIEEIVATIETDSQGRIPVKSLPNLAKKVMEQGQKRGQADAGNGSVPTF